MSGEVGPDPEVELPATGGGPLKDSEDALEDQAHVIDGSPDPTRSRSRRISAVVTEGWPGDTGWARSEANAHDVEGFFIDADKVDSECRADLSGVTGSTDIADGTYFDDNFDISCTGPGAPGPERGARATSRSSDSTGPSTVSLRPIASSSRSS